MGGGHFWGYSRKNKNNAPHRSAGGLIQLSPDCTGGLPSRLAFPCHVWSCSRKELDPSSEHPEIPLPQGVQEVREEGLGLLSPGGWPTHLRPKGASQPAVLFCWRCGNRGKHSTCVLAGEILVQWGGGSRGESYKVAQRPRPASARPSTAVLHGKQVSDCCLENARGGPLPLPHPPKGPTLLPPYFTSPVSSLASALSRPPWSSHVRIISQVSFPLWL